MATITDTVRPGDVISSDLINRMIALLNDHEGKLAGAGSGTSTNVISGFDPDPQTGQNVGRTLTIFGNFDFPLDTNTVSIDGVPIAPSAFLSGSNNTQIRFVIPSTIAVTGVPTRSVIVHVVNSKGLGERTYTIRPQVAGQPDPTIISIVDNASNSPTLITGLVARITGLNFATPAVNNRVRLIFNPGPNQTAFPPTSGDSLPIDPTTSVINPAPQPSTLMVTMPQVGPPLIPTVGPSVTAHLELTAMGANNPAGQDLNIRRTS
jgi:hypothetical protein